MIVNILNKDTQFDNNIKDYLRKLFRGTRIHSSILDVGTSGMIASIERTSTEMKVSIYNTSRSVNFEYQCKSTNDTYLDVRLVNKNNRHNGPDIGEVEYLSSLSKSYGH